MTVGDTSYFREFLDFAYLWMRDRNKDVPATYQPVSANEELWEQINLDAVLTHGLNLFELCPMHALGRIADRPPRKQRKDPFVLTVSLNPGRNRTAERLEQEHRIFDEFGDNGSILIARCANYFQTVGAKGGFWHKISRVSRQSLRRAGFDSHMTQGWMDVSVAHVDLWPLRLGRFQPFFDHHHAFPQGFQLPTRQQMLIELISAADADLTLLLGQQADLGLAIIQLPELDVELRHPNEGHLIPEFEIFRVDYLPRCYRIRHPASRSCLVQWDNTADRIRIDLNNIIEA